MAVSLYAYLPLIAALLSPGLGLYVLARNPYMRTGKAFFLTMVLSGALGMCHFFLLTAPDEGTALSFGAVTIFVGVLTFGSLWYLTAFLSYGRVPFSPSDHPRSFWAAVTVLALLCAAAVDAIVLTEVGYGLPLTTGAFLGELTSLLLAAGASVTALGALRRSKDARFRRMCLLLALTPQLPFALSVALLVLQVLPLVAPAFLSMGLLYGYFVLQHRVFAITSHRPKRREDIAPGGAVLVKGRDPQAAYRLFAAEVRSGASGLVVARSHPDRVREAIGLPDVPVLWLSSQPGADRIDPASLNILQHSVNGFIGKGGPSVLLLEGMEYLIAQNSLDKVLRLLYAIRDTTTIAGSKLIIPLDPLTLHERDLALVEKEFPARTEAEAEA